MEPKIQIGQNVKTLRRSLGLSRDALATRSGMSAAAINSIERGDRSPRSENLIALSKALGVTWERLVTYHVNENAPPSAIPLTDEEIVRLVAAKFGVSIG